LEGGGRTWRSLEGGGRALEGCDNPWKWAVVLGGPSSGLEGPRQHLGEGRQELGRERRCGGGFWSAVGGEEKRG